MDVTVPKIIVVETNADRVEASPLNARISE